LNGGRWGLERDERSAGDRREEKKGSKEKTQSSKKTLRIILFIILFQS